MNLLETLSDFYGMAMWSRFMLVVIAWLIWPGLMFFLGAVFESRVVPIGQGQSKAFFPGDLSIGVMLVAFISMYDKTGVAIPLVQSVFWWVLLAAVLVIVAFRIRLNDIQSYSRRAARSPTKIAHDVIGYYLSPLLLIGLGVPQLCVLHREGVFEATRMGWFAAAMSIVLYLFCIALDMITFYDAKDIASRHPEHWQPIWKTRRR